MLCYYFSCNRAEVVLLMDEPTAACDAVSCSAVEQAITRCGAACLLITHDERQAARIAHRRILLSAATASISASTSSSQLIEDKVDV